MNRTHVGIMLLCVAACSSPMHVDPAALIKDCTEHKMSCRLKYKDVTLEVKGELDRPVKENKFLVIEAVMDYGGHVVCAVPRDQAALAEELKQGDRVTFRGKFASNHTYEESGRSWVLIEPCHLSRG